MALRPVQALALHDAGVYGGLFAPIGVGEGKTLISLLLPVVFEARRPLLLLPAGLIEKTRREQARLAQQWRIPNRLRIFSYDLLGRVQSADELDNYEPDLIIADEAHRLKNRRAAVTRRVARYMVERPLTIVCVMSGTIMDKGLRDFAHLLKWSLKLCAPVPTTNEELDEWAEALDEGVDPLARRRAGALLSFCAPEDRRAPDGTALPEYVAARRGFRRRLNETPGVVSTIGEGEHVDCSIYVRGIRHSVRPVTEANFAKLRGDWLTPDDWQLMYATEVYEIAKELALGLHYVWDPRPPDEWRNARRDWHAFVRDTISRSRTYDSELHVANACDAGHLDATALQRWREIRGHYTPCVKAIWHDSSALEACTEWMRSPGIVWTKHILFAEELARRTGVTYYGADGYSATGEYVEDADPKKPAILSVDANKEGKNLQYLWSRNLLVCPPSSALLWEQVIGRTHRPGQTADEVVVDVLLGCRENFDACMKALDLARAVNDTTGKMQKLLIADVSLPDTAEIEGFRSPRWVR
jgi:hypothetical protein